MEKMKFNKLSKVGKITWIQFVIVLLYNIKIFVDLINHIPNEATYFWEPIAMILSIISIIKQSKEE